VTSEEVMNRRACLAVAASLVFVLPACGGDDSAGDGDVVENGAGPRVAAVFSGLTTDADFTSLGFLALRAAEANGAEVAFSESTAIPDAERVIQEYVADGFEVIWTHGSQFYEATSNIATQNPEVTFIGEFDGMPEGQPDNVWVLDRNFHIGFYAVGVLASELSSTGTVGYVGGLSLPFSYSEVHAMEQAIADTGAATEINPVWTGDFDDPARAQQITTQLLNQGADVIVGSLNLGLVGTFQAVEDRPAGEVWVTGKYTDKSQFGAEHYAGSVIYDFNRPLEDVLARIAEGETSGYYSLGFETGVQIQVGDNVPDEVRTVVEDVTAQIQDGSIEVERDVTAIE
jgi:basic membrane protein A